MSKVHGSWNHEIVVLCLRSDGHSVIVWRSYYYCSQAYQGKPVSF